MRNVVRTRIHVNGGAIKRNRKLPAKAKNLEPVLTVKDYKQNRKGNFVVINGPSVVKYQNKAIKGGARAWIETYACVDVI